RRQLGVHGLETALYTAHPQHLINAQRLGPALHRDGAEITVMELSPGEPARAGADQHGLRLRHCLQARGKVRRLANYVLLRRGLLNQKLGYDHSARRNPDANLQRCGDIAETRYGANERERRAHCLFGIILMGVRIAEIDQRTVTHIARYLSLITAYDFRDAV